MTKKSITCYPTEETAAQFDDLMEYYRRKHEGSGVRVTESFVLSEIIRQKFVDVRNQETQSLTMRKVYDEIQALKALIEDRLPSSMSIEELFSSEVQRMGDLIASLKEN